MSEQKKYSNFLDEIKMKLEKNFKIEDNDQVLVEDKTYLHLNHKKKQMQQDNNQENYPSHLHVVVKSSKFKNLSILDKHKMIYSTLKNEVSLLHAISIDTE